MNRIVEIRDAIPSGPAIHNHIKFSAGVGAKGNATYQGLRIDPTGWRFAACAIRRDKTFDEKRKRAFASAIRIFDVVLDSPIRIYETYGYKVVEVFRALQYFTHQNKKRVGCLCLNAVGNPTGAVANVTIFPALKGTGWIQHVLDSWNLDWRSENCKTNGVLDEQEQLLIRRLSKVIVIDSRFQALRLRIGSELLGAELLSVAVRTKTQRGIDSDEATSIWRNWGAVCEVARVSPNLLPLLGLWLSHEPPRFKLSATNVMQDLKHWFLRGHGELNFPERTWTWVCRYGTRAFQKCIRDDRFGIHHIAQTLTAITETNSQVILSQSLLQLFITHNGRPTGTDENWCRMPATVKRILLREASIRQKTPQFTEWCGKAVNVLFSVTSPQFKLRPVKGKAGWKWLEKQAEISDLQRSEAHESVEGWCTPLQTMQLNGVEVEPITSYTQLHLAGVLLQNCAVDLAPMARTGSICLFLIKKESGKPHALVCLRRDSDEPNLWSVRDVKGKANSTPSPLAIAIADQLTLLTNK